MTMWMDAGPAELLVPEEPLPVEVAGRALVLFRLADGVFALDDLCSHGKARLSDGFIEGNAIECPLHQGLICIRSGAPLSAPITTAVARHDVRERDDRLEVLL